MLLSDAVGVEPKQYERPAGAVGDALAVANWKRPLRRRMPRHVSYIGVSHESWGAEDKTIPPRHHHAQAAQVPHAVTVQIVGAGHYPHETAPAPLLSAMLAFLSTTQPFGYVEDRWIQQLTHPQLGDATAREGRSASGCRPLHP